LESDGKKTIDGEIVRFDLGKGRGEIMAIVDNRRERFAFPQSEVDKPLRKPLKRAIREKNTFTLADPIAVVFEIGDFTMPNQETMRVAKNIRKRRMPEP
jgi:hypothetical protein